MRECKDTKVSFLVYTTEIDDASFTKIRILEVIGIKFTPLVLDTLHLRCI